MNTNVSTAHYGRGVRVPKKWLSIGEARVLLFSLGVFGGCAFEEDAPNIGDSQHLAATTYTLIDDLYLPCGSTAHWTRHPQTTFSIQLNTGDTIFVGSDTLIEYPMSEWAGNLNENPSTELACRPGSAPTDFSVLAETQGRTDQNLHNRDSPNLSDTHFNRAMYTATQDGTHYCDVIYYCGPVPAGNPDPDGQVVVRAGSTIFHHPINQFPGTNWKFSGDMFVTDTSGTTRIQTQTWNPGPDGLATAGFDELVVRWSPQVDDCLASDVDAGNPNAICLGGSYKGYDHDTYFRWRLGVSQYKINADNTATLCNTAVGAWSNSVVCTHDNHHCDINIYTTNFPILDTTACGGASAKRKFTVFADLKKDLVGSPYSDMRVHGGAGTNLMVYAHHLP
jgi:hypothetical protein